MIGIRYTTKQLLGGLVFSTLFSAACHTNGIAEKTARIPGQSWPASFVPSFDFQINDTASHYRLFVVIRHADAYRYKNMWVEISVTVPGEPKRTEKVNLLLATDEKGWLGKGMDDIFEHRVLLNEYPSAFRKKGSYTFAIRHLMREDPLAYVLNAGFRIEKVIE